METTVANQLEDANKLIFVKRYADAEKVLDDVVASPAGKTNLVAHVRRIELAAMLKKLDRLRGEYLKNLRENGPSLIDDTCLAFVEQHNETHSSADQVVGFQELLKIYGPFAAAYYGIGYSMEAQGNHERAVFNYEQAINLDPDWYIAYFGLSQVYYQLGEEKKGDHFFYLFEQAAPYNVYGNFETHRKLCTEFLENERYAEAEAAIQTLSEWWMDNKGACPTEVQIYELLATARISEAQGDRAQAESRRSRAGGLALIALDDQKTTEGVLYFIAKVLEEFDDFPKAYKFYRKILRNEGQSPVMVQKIGSQFLSMGEYRLARDLFQEAYDIHPENPDIRFCLLVSSLKLAGVNVEEYLIGRERLRQLTGDNGGDKVELLALLHSLLAKFTGDADVQGHIADVYLRLGNVERARRHYLTMYELDGKNRATALKHASFMMQHGEPDAAIAILSKIVDSDTLAAESQAEIFWLKANYYARIKNYRESQILLRRVLALDPWNVSYLVQEVVNLVNLAPLDDELRKIDPVLATLSAVDDSRIEWADFDANTRRMEAAHAYELVYARRKLRYLYANGSEAALMELVQAACRHDATRGTYDFMKLLNTNFDSPSIHWALGIIFKELWRLETACVWFEQMLLYPSISKAQQAKAYAELADCYIWQGHSFEKAIEYAKLAFDLDPRDSRVLRILSHAYLKSGQIRQAKVHLDQADPESDHEVRYLQGLLQYRNGARQQANELWKPLLTVRSESLRFHNIKQEVLKFYFEGTPYLKAN